MAKQATAPVAQPLGEPVQEGPGTGGGEPCLGPPTVQQVYCIPAGVTTYTIPTTGCQDGAGTLEWIGPQGTFSTGASATITDAKNPDSWGDHTLHFIPLGGGPATVQDFTVFGPLTIRAWEGYNTQVPRGPGSYICQGNYVRFRIQQPSGWTQDRWTNIAWQVNPSPVTAFTVSNSGTEITLIAGDPAQNGLLTYTVSCTATSPCGGTQFTSFTFYAKVRDAACGPVQRPAVGAGQELNQALAYPVPAAASLTVPRPEGSLVELYNGHGVRVRASQGTGPEVRLVTQDLPDGLYLLRTTTYSHQVSEQRIIVRH